MADVSTRSQRPAILIDGGQGAVRRDLQDRAGSLRRRRSRKSAFLGVNRFHGRAHVQRLQDRGELSAAARMVQRGVAAALNCCRGAAAAVPVAGGRWSGKGADTGDRLAQVLLAAPAARSMNAQSQSSRKRERWQHLCYPVPIV